MYKITFDLKTKDDLKIITKKNLEQIRKSARTKLTEKPTIFGKPLRGPLTGFWSLRAGDFRIIYRIIGVEVNIVYIAHRKFVYGKAKKRLGRA